MAEAPPANRRGPRLACAAIAFVAWTAMLYLARRYGAGMQFPIGLIVSYLSLGVPAFVLAGALTRLRATMPMVWCVIVYLLADGGDLALRTLDVDAARRAAIWAVRSLSLGTSMPLVNGGFTFVWLNVLSLVVVALVAQYGGEAVRGRSQRDA